MTDIDSIDPRRLLDLAFKGDKADCMAAIQFLELQGRVSPAGAEGVGRTAWASPDSPSVGAWSRHVESSSRS